MDDQTLLRYSRHIFLPEIDLQGQEKIMASSVAILGLGGLGSPAAMYLASSGVGAIHLIDDDQVELSNLQRQIIHTTDRLGEHKVDSAIESLRSINPEVCLHGHKNRLQESDLERLLLDCDVLLDCSDNFQTRFACNRAAFASKTPLVSGAAINWVGQIISLDFRVPLPPCYRCLFDEAGEDENNCSESGVVAPLVGVMGSMQALEAIKFLLATGDDRADLHGNFSSYDAALGHWRQRKIMADPNCPVCFASITEDA